MYKPLVTILGLTAILAGFSSCEGVEQPGGNTGEIVLRIDSDRIDIQQTTKAESGIVFYGPTEGGIPDKLYYSATIGSSKEQSKWQSALKNVEEGKIKTGIYQSLVATEYNHYLSNSQLNYDNGNTYILADNSKDVLIGKVRTTNVSPSITLSHALARSGSLTCNPQPGYTIKNVSWQIESKSGSQGGGCADRYNITTNSWMGPRTPLTKQNLPTDASFLCVPGVYYIYVTYTLCIGDYEKTLTKKGEVNFKQGMRNHFICTAIGGDAKEIAISVDVAPWGDDYHTVTLTNI